MEHIAHAIHMRSCRKDHIFEREKQVRERILLDCQALLEHRSLRCNALARATRDQAGRLMLCITGSPDRCGRMTAHAWLRLAYDYPTAAAPTLAEIFRCSTNTVKVSMQLVAHMYLALQLQVSRRIAAVAAERRNLAFAVWALSFDETSKTMLLPQSQCCTLSHAQRRSTLHVLVSLSRMILAWSFPHSSALLLQQCGLVRPSVLLVGTSADCLFHSLFEAPPIRDASNACLSVLDQAQMSALHFGRDGCSANDKFLAHIMDALARAHPSLLISDKICICTATI